MNRHSGTPELFPGIFYAACQSCGRTLLGLLTVLPAALLAVFAAFRNPPHHGRKRVAFVFAGLLLLTGGVARAQGSSVAGDRAALLALYNVTNGRNWTDNTNWRRFNEPLSAWHGVATNDDGRVTGLNLSYNELRGYIPAWLGQTAWRGQLDQLRYLSLAGNQLTGEIPRWLGRLAWLESLSLGRNQLTGEIPAALARLALLESLSLGRNQLTGEIPAWLARLDQLRDLNLSYNGLTGEIPVQLGQLTQLRDLNLGGNQLTDEIPAALGQLTRLTSLNLRYNQLTGEIPVQLGQLTQLRDLNLGGNDPYKSLKTTLKAEVNREAWETLHSDTSRPFDKPKSGRIAVKAINHLGDEVMKVFKV